MHQNYCSALFNQEIPHQAIIPWLHAFVRHCPAEFSEQENKWNILARLIHENGMSRRGWVYHEGLSEQERTFLVDRIETILGSKVYKETKFQLVAWVLSSLLKDIPWEWQEVVSQMQKNCIMAHAK